MNDRMTVSAQTQWSNINPPAQVVEIYHNWTIADAYWDALAQVWRNPKTNEVITSYAYWRTKR